MNLQDLRNGVRTQLDLDEEDLPNALVDLYLREAFEQTIAFERRWPFYETTWGVTATDENPVALPTDVGGIAAVTEVETGVVLLYVSHQLAEENFRGTLDTGTPRMFSTWGGNVYFWPASDGERAYTIRGYRTPIDWVTLGAAADVDADSRLHLPLIHYAVSRAYAQQEDEVLTEAYLQTWARTVEAARKAIMRPDYQGLSQLNYGLHGNGPTRRYQLVLD
jgi:hypothetical protein